MKPAQNPEWSFLDFLEKCVIYLDMKMGESQKWQQQQQQLLAQHIFILNKIIELYVRLTLLATPAYLLALICPGARQAGGKTLGGSDYIWYSLAGLDIGITNISYPHDRGP